MGLGLRVDSGWVSRVWVSGFSSRVFTVIRVDRGFRV